jgi:hypothetical protein
MTHRLSLSLFSALVLACNGGGATDDSDSPSAPGSNLPTDTASGTEESSQASTAPPCDPTALPLGGGDGTSSSPFTVCSVAHLNNLRDLGFAGEEQMYWDIRLTADIDLNGVAWVPIPTLFANIDGGGHTISNLSVATTTDNMFGGFATQLEGAYLKNLTFEKLTVTSPGRAFGISAYPDIAEVRNVHVVGGTITSTNPDDGNTNTTAVGFFPSFSGDLTNVSFEGTISAAKATVGAGGQNAMIVGSFHGTAKNVRGKGAVNVEATVGNGGLFGSVAADARVEDCEFEGVVTSKGDYLGGIAGTVGNGAVIDGCRFNGAVSSTGGYVGGIAGYITGQPFASSPSNEGVVRRVMVDGSVDGRTYVGGVAGELFGGRVEHAFFLGVVEAEYYAGGAIGHLLQRFEGENVAGGFDHIITVAVVEGASEWTDHGILGVSYHALTAGRFDGMRGAYTTDLSPLSGLGAAEPTTVLGLTSVQMKQASHFSAWPSEIWQFTDGSYPSIK